MFAGAMLLGFLAFLGLPDFMGGDKSDDTDDDLPDEVDAPDGDGVLTDVEEGREFIAGDEPGVSLIEDFQPGEDVLNLRVPSDVDQVLVQDAEDDSAACVSYTWADEIVEVQFAGLESVPVDDINVLIDGDSEGIPLAALLQDEEDVLPNDPEDPSEPGDPDGSDDEGLPPNDPEEPSEPGGSGTGDDVDGLPPNDPSQPSGGTVASDLTALMARDGADPTGQTDTADAVLETGDSNDALTLPDDGITGTGEGHAELSEAAVVTGGDVVDLGAGDDTLVAGDSALYGFGGDGADDMTAGEGAAALYGGAGDDALTGTTADTGLLHGGSGDDTITGGSGDEYLDGGEHGEAAEDGDDVIDGGAGDDTIRGGWGADSLSGGDGDDVIDHRGTDEQRTIAEEWHDDWTEDGAQDTLDGGAGNDTLILGSGDLATGGEGADVFWLYPEDAGSDPAVITDFEPGEDFLRITIDPASADEVTMDLSDDGADVLVMIGGEVVAVLEGGAGADLTDVYVEVKADVFPTGGATAA